eukprot:9634663-Alexandrium_andersonii.AAC.1
MELCGGVAAMLKGVSSGRARVISRNIGNSPSRDGGLYSLMAGDRRLLRPGHMLCWSVTWWLVQAVGL